MLPNDNKMFLLVLSIYTIGFLIAAFLVIPFLIAREKIYPDRTWNAFKWAFVWPVTVPLILLMYGFIGLVEGCSFLFERSIKMFTSFPKPEPELVESKTDYRNFQFKSTLKK